MTRLKFAPAILAAGAAMLLATPAIASDPSGTYKRKNGDTVRVFLSKGKLYCRITKGKKKNFEMCHGMAKTATGYYGKKMKHPGMPGFMTFNGTVTYNATSLSIKGCAMGKSMCDKEKWSKIS
ncbi:MAG: hypothetical protein V3V15_00315 [Sphingorhabdus sp.]